MADEIDFNAFYHILRNKFRKKYEFAVSKCWTICIPCSTALKGIDVTEEFVDVHILKPSHIPDHYQSTDENNSHIFHLVNNKLTLGQAPNLPKETYVIKIISIESGYNKEFQLYKIFIVNKPLSPKFRPKLYCDDDVLHLNQKITSMHEASVFLTRFSEHTDLLFRLDEDLTWFCDTNKFQPDDLSAARDKIHSELNARWVVLLQTHPLELQRDARFQSLLTISLENYILNRIHEDLFPVVSAGHKTKDKAILERIQELAAVGVTADQLGAPEDFAVPLPAAVVELASLDTLTCPVDKLTCLRTTLDLILAELKGAIVDAHSQVTVPFDSELPTLATDDLIPLLMSVIIQAKPLHMASNLYYMENFQWTLSPNDATSFSLVTFKAAVQELLVLDANQLKPRSEKVHRELGLEELIKVTGELGERFDRSGGRRLEGPISPLDRQLERVTAMIEASTRELSFSEESVPVEQQLKSEESDVQQRPAMGKQEDPDV